jgi:hypothetical protein
MARNSSLARFAVSAASRACCSRWSSVSRSHSPRAALGGGVDERVSHVLDLADRGRGRDDRLAAAERLRRAAPAPRSDP